jgi:hypothetical protein
MNTKEYKIKTNRSHAALRRKLTASFKDTYGYKKQEAYDAYIERFRPDVSERLFMEGRNAVVNYLFGNGEFNGYERSKSAWRKELNKDGYSKFLKSFKVRKKY